MLNNHKLQANETLEVLTELLTEICEESTERSDSNPIEVKPFLSKKIPSISIKKFFDRIFKYTKIENSTLILILIYIDRLCEKQKFLLNYYNIHKIILASMLLAIKYNEDEYFKLTFYAKVGGISIKEIQELEYEMAFLMDYNFFVSDEVFNKYNEYILSVKENESNYE